VKAGQVRTQDKQDNNQNLAEVICGFTEARKTAPQMAPIPVTLFKVPYVQRSRSGSSWQ